LRLLALLDESNYLFECRTFAGFFIEAHFDQLDESLASITWQFDLNGLMKSKKPDHHRTQLIQ
jgi:hypothetical protein